MKKLLFSIFLLLFLTGCPAPSAPEKSSPATDVITASAPTTQPTVPAPIETEPEPESETTVPIPVISLTEEEKNMLLKIGMAERGESGCTECIALVMRTVLNRVNADRFGSSIRSVLFAQDQFTPVMDGSYESAQPNDRCQEALEMVISGWDESQGALYYEWCEGPSWHSQNLHLLFQHCDTRFYD